MIRNLKVLGVAALAVFAFTALSVSSAAASGEKFHAGQAHTILSANGTNNQVFKTPAGEVVCKKVTGNGTTSEVTPGQVTAENIAYSECTTKTIFGTINVTVDFKGCDYLFTADTAQQTHIVCPAGTGPVTITGPGCTITVGAQTVNGVTYSNSGSHVNINAAVTNITSTATGFFCSATGTSNTGTYNGTVTVSGATTAGAAVTVSYG